MDHCAAEAGHVVIFDRNPDRSWVPVRAARIMCTRTDRITSFVTPWPESNGSESGRLHRERRSQLSALPAYGIPVRRSGLHQQMRDLLSLDLTRRSPLLKGPYVSLSRPFRDGATVSSLVDEGLFHPHLHERIPDNITHLPQPPGGGDPGDHRWANDACLYRHRLRQDRVFPVSHREPVSEAAR